jgi:hypothetical protein
MRARWCWRWVAGAALAAAACHHSPEEASVDAAPEATTIAQPEAAAPEAAAADERPEEQDAAPSPASAFCTAAYSADLERLRTKCAPGDLEASQGLTRVAANMCARDMSLATARGRVTFDQGAADKCVDMLRRAPLNQSSEADTIFTHAPCDRVLVGTQGEDDPCRFSVECKDGLACVGYRIGGEGICKKPPRLKETCARQPFGTTLNETAASLHHPACVRGAWCDGGTCKPRVTTGKACTSGLECADGLACVTGKCGARVPAGGACVHESDCVFGLRCDRSGGAGAPPLNGTVDAGGGRCAVKRPEGESCTSFDDCKGRCDLPKSTGGVRAPGRCVSVCGSG